jgi:UDPglucose 6-dehydrogenase
MKVGFIGLGKLGMPCAEVFATKFDTYGFDINPVVSDKVKISNSLKELICVSDFIFIAIQTPHDKLYGGETPASHLPKKDFNYSSLENCLNELNLYSSDNKIIIIISTVLPGTVRSSLSKIITKGALLYNPYLIAMGTVKEDFCNPEMVIIGNECGNKDEHSVKKLIQLYKSLINPDARYEIGTWEEAESIKIFYNTFISAKIAIVNMIQDVAHKLGNMNVDVVTNAIAKSDKRIVSQAYMKAGMGDGGPCHPRDNIALSSLAKKLDLGYDLFDAISVSREVQAKNLASFLIKFELPIVILGSNYKPNTQLTDGSYSLLVGYYVREFGCEVYFDNHPDENSSFTYLLSHEHVYNNFPFTTNSVVVDIWRSLKLERKDLGIVCYGSQK